MKIGLIIKNGTCEHPCWQNDDNTCSYICPNFCNKEGFTYNECIVLNMSHEDKDFKCAIKL